MFFGLLVWCSLFLFHLYVPDACIMLYCNREQIDEV
jgi:hypothetical protein